LEGVVPKLVLRIAGPSGPGSRFSVVEPEDVKHISRFQGCGFVGFPFSIDQQWKRDTGLITKEAGIMNIAESNRCQRGSGTPEVVLVFAQLRDVLAAKDSAIMPQEDDHGGTVLP
jgi:hypothetical protein